MARMIPPSYSEDIKSSGEKRIFDLLKNDPATADWICMHSLGLAQHVKRVYGEIDFVVLVPNEGIFCLEIKSGRISRQEGVWTYTNKYGASSTSTVGPFMQARDGMFSLIEGVKKYITLGDQFSRLLFGFGVLFPHISFDQGDLDIESWQVYDRDSRRLPISRFILGLARSTRRNVEKRYWYDDQNSRPTSSDISKIVDFLRGDFEQIVRPADELLETEKRILRLTTEQYASIDQLQDNPRCLFTGGAGTGKTLLALEYVRREVLSGRKVLLVCFNKMLGNWLSSQIADLPSESVKVGSYHNLLDYLISLSSAADEFREAKTTEDRDYLFYELYPLFALDALEQGVIESFDNLVIDEGQDLIRSEFLDVFDNMLKGGLVGGKWAVFCDFHHQTIYGDVEENTMLSELEQRAPHFVRFRLYTNCRNTRPIGEEVSFISGFEIPPFLPANVEGVPVNYSFFNDTDDQCNILNEIVSKLHSEDIKREYITILSPVTLDHSCLSKDDLRSFKVVDLTESESLKYPRKAVGFSTIHAFKGLENSIIIITDVTHLLNNRYRSLLYVGMSRARHRLFVLLAESAREEYQGAIRIGFQKESMVQ